jgi:hypothetical protein
MEGGALSHFWTTPMQLRSGRLGSSSSQRVRGGGEGEGRRCALVDFFTVIAAGEFGPSSGYFFVLGQINRHGWLFTVAVNSFTF